MPIGLIRFGMLVSYPIGAVWVGCMVGLTAMVLIDMGTYAYQKW